MELTTQKNEMWWEDNEPVVVLEKWGDMSD